MKYIYSILILTFLISCKNDAKKLTNPIFETENFISPEKVYINEILSPEFISKIGDVMLVSSSRSDSMVHMYNIPKLSHISSFGTKGEGPDDITVFPMFCESKSEYSYIWGYNPIKIRKFALSGDNLSLVKEISLPFYDAFNFMNIINDRYFYYLNVDLLQIKKVDLENNETSEISFKKDPHSESFYYSNRGVMAANNNFIVYAYVYKNQIDIYNASNLKLYKRLITSSDGFPIKDGDKYNLTNQYYSNVITTEKHIYAYCKNANNIPVLEVYDYEGNPKNKYVLETPIPLFIVDETENLLVGINYSDDEHFYVYNIAK